MSTSLLELAKAKDVKGVLSSYRTHPEDDVAAAADHLREDDLYHVAIELYGWLLERQETSAARYGMGQCHGKIYDYETAAEHLGRAFELDPDRTLGASYYAYILERLGRLDAAAPWYERALEGDDAGDLWARSHYAWFLEKCGKPDESVAAYRDVLERNPSYTWAVKRLALLLRNLGRREDAEKVIAGAVASAPTNLFARLNLLEYRLIDEDAAGYAQVRATVSPLAGPPWHAVVVALFDLYRDCLLPGMPDGARFSAWEATAVGLTDSVHRDFDDLTELLSSRGGDVETWRRFVQLLLK